MERINIYITRDQKQALQAIAEAQGETVSFWVRQALREFFNGKVQQETTGDGSNSSEHNDAGK